MSAEQPRILVVDDNPATRYSTSRVLSAASFQIASAATGAEALRNARQDIDLVILDVDLPDIDGYEIARRLRADPATARLPIVHLSASLVGDSHKVRGLEAGSDTYMVHPVEPTVLVGTVRAFLRARRAEEATRASEARFRGVFDQALNGILLVDAGELCLETNPAMCALLGRTREQLVGQPVRDWFAPEHEPTLAQMRAALAERGSWEGYVPMLHADGALVELEWRVSLPPGGESQVMIATDVRERRRLEYEREQLFQRERAARSEAERNNRIKDEFLATLSHELRNPLNAIVGWSSVLLHSGLSGQVHEAVQAIERNARIQAQLISDLLDVSRITSGKMNLELLPLQFEAIVAAALPGVMPSANAKQVQIECRGLESVAGKFAVLGDTARLQQVVWNLLSNAVKFTPAGGLVTVLLEQSDGQVRLTISDSGKGISAEFLPYIFERFRQEESTTRKAYSGLGLGLAIVRNIVAMHGGHVAASSAGENQGSSFIVTLPAAPAHLGVLSAPSVLGSLEATRLERLRVLVVDDDADARALMRRLLHDAGAIVSDAVDVNAALELVESFAPGVLVSDIGMAGRDGYDLIRQIRDRRSAVELPAIAVTAFARSEDRRDALHAGFQMHLTKPVDPRELLAAVFRVRSDADAG